MSHNKHSSANPLPGAVDINVPRQLRSQRAPTVRETAPAPRSKASKKHKASACIAPADSLPVSAVNVDDSSQNTQLPESKTPTGKNKISHRIVLPVSLADAISPLLASAINADDCALRSSRLPPGPKSKTHADNDKISCSILAKTIQPPPPKSMSSSTIDMPQNIQCTATGPKPTVMLSRKRKHPEEESTSAASNISEGTHGVQKRRLLVASRSADISLFFYIHLKSLLNNGFGALEGNFAMLAGLELSGESTRSSQPQPLAKNPQPSNEFDRYWDDPNFFRRRMSGGLCLVGFRHGLDSEVSPRNTVGAHSDDMNDEKDVPDGDESSGGDHSADEQKHKHDKQEKYKATELLPPPSPENSDFDSTSSPLRKKTCSRISRSLLPNSSLPPSSPDLNSPLASLQAVVEFVSASLFGRHPPLDNAAPPPPHGPPPSRLRPESPPRLTAAQKGKARQQSPEEKPDGVQMKPGPMPKVAWDKARGLGQRMLTAADQLAREFGKSQRDILIAAGLGATTSHKKRNDANTYRSWYWNMQKIPSDKSRSEINEIINMKYKELFMGVLEKDHETRDLLMAPYNEWLDEHETVGLEKDVKSIAIRVQRCKDQMASMAESWSNLEDIEVVGAVIYLGNDPAGAQTSGVFGGSENVRGYIDDNHVNIRQMLSNYMTILYRRLQGDSSPTAGIDVNFTGNNVQMSAPSNPFMPDRASLALHCQHKEIARDCNRRVLVIMFREKLTQVFREIYGNRSEYPDPQKILASSWLSAAYKHTMFIGCWPLENKFPGPGFSFKGLGNRELHMIVGPYLKCKLGIMYDDERPAGQEEVEEKQEFEIFPWEKEWVQWSDLKERKDAAKASRPKTGGPSRSTDRTVAHKVPCPASPTTAVVVPPAPPSAALASAPAPIKLALTRLHRLWLNRMTLTIIIRLPRPPYRSQPHPPLRTAQHRHGGSVADTINDDYEMADAGGVDVSADVERTLHARTRMHLPPPGEHWQPPHRPIHYAAPVVYHPPPLARFSRSQYLPANYHDELYSAQPQDDYYDQGMDVDGGYMDYYE
ncbi:hypothetical protein K503DRAFT_802529 [Rhizopogon vinicolor AM-OR11-026]|uniref:Uncharacterized protein n=1 Tax=Rhizopogon vinicolor AM-OR11-026 TaxID=1314800 RepID=A0A1B7MT68_9AGAM|nr:hypothetical protein K503DRAFT_802529 [Rhizopogon vinicolor AM-OR11-026]